MRVRSLEPGLLLWDSVIYVLLGCVGIAVIFFMISYVKPYFRFFKKTIESPKSIGTPQTDESLTFEGLDELLAQDSKEQKAKKARDFSKAQGNLKKDEKAQEQAGQEIQAPPSQETQEESLGEKE